MGLTGFYLVSVVFYLVSMGFDSVLLSFNGFDWNKWVLLGFTMF